MKATMTCLCALTICLLGVLSPAWGKVIHRGDCDSSFELVVNGKDLSLVASFHNRSAEEISLTVPAGARFLGQVEPCAPVVLGRDLKVVLPPGAKKTVKAEALSTSFYLNTAGRYELAWPSEEDLLICQSVQRVWAQHRDAKLRTPPVRLSQLVVYFGSGADKKKIRQQFTDAEILEAKAILKPE